MARPSTTGYAQASAPAVLEPAYAGRVPHPLARLRARDWRTERTGRAAVVVMLVAAAILVVAAAAQPSALVPPAKGGFPVWMVGPFHGLASWLPDTGMFNSVLFSALMAAMFGCYLVAVACVRQLPFRFGVGAIAALHVVFLLGPPLPLTDAFNYLDYARLGAVLAGVDARLEDACPPPGRRTRRTGSPPGTTSSAPTGRCSPCSPMPWCRWACRWGSGC